MERITEIFVVLENKPGTLGEMCSHLAEHGVNIEAIGVFQDTAKLLVKNINKAVKLLKRLDYEIELRDVLLVELENRPGALADVTSKLGNKGINVEYCYGTISRKENAAAVILDVSDLDKALKLLK
ncbi:MAG: ACT domain-containing protein [Candidatus Aminicenantaceae bacterium]